MNIFLIITVITTALMAGLFYSWSISVTPGLKNIQDRSYLEAIQAMNKAILNPAFFSIFFGSIIFLLIVSVLQFNTAINLRFWVILSALIIYYSGTIGVTIFGNVPMNNKLENLDISKMTNENMQSVRLNFESRWNLFNTIRTLTSTLTFIILLAADKFT